MQEKAAAQRRYRDELDAQRRLKEELDQRKKTDAAPAREVVPTGGLFAGLGEAQKPGSGRRVSRTGNRKQVDIPLPPHKAHPAAPPASKASAPEHGREPAVLEPASAGGGGSPLQLAGNQQHPYLLQQNQLLGGPPPPDAGEWQSLPPGQDQAPSPLEQPQQYQQQQYQQQQMQQQLQQQQFQQQQQQQQQQPAQQQQQQQFQQQQQQQQQQQLPFDQPSFPYQNDAPPFNPSPDQARALWDSPAPEEQPAPPPLPPASARPPSNGRPPAEAGIFATLGQRDADAKARLQSEYRHALEQQQEADRRTRREETDSRRSRDPTGPGALANFGSEHDKWRQKHRQPEPAFRGQSTVSDAPFDHHQAFAAQAPPAVQPVFPVAPDVAAQYTPQQLGAFYAQQQAFMQQLQQQQQPQQHPSTASAVSPASLASFSQPVSYSAPAVRAGSPSERRGSNPGKGGIQCVNGRLVITSDLDVERLKKEKEAKLKWKHELEEQQRLKEERMRREKEARKAEERALEEKIRAEHDRLAAEELQKKQAEQERLKKEREAADREIEARRDRQQQQRHQREQQEKHEEEQRQHQRQQQGQQQQQEHEQQRRREHNQPPAESPAFQRQRQQQQHGHEQQQTREHNQPAAESPGFKRQHQQQQQQHEHEHEQQRMPEAFAFRRDQPLEAGEPPPHVGAAQAPPPPSNQSPPPQPEPGHLRQLPASPPTAAPCPDCGQTADEASRFCKWTGKPHAFPFPSSPRRDASPAASAPETPPAQWPHAGEVSQTGVSTAGEKTPAFGATPVAVPEPLPPATAESDAEEAEHAVSQLFGGGLPAAAADDGALSPLANQPPLYRELAPAPENDAEPRNVELSDADLYRYGFGLPSPLPAPGSPREGESLRAETTFIYPSNDEVGSPPWSKGGVCELKQSFAASDRELSLDDDEPPNQQQQQQQEQQPPPGSEPRRRGKEAKEARGEEQPDEGSPPPAPPRAAAAKRKVRKKAVVDPSPPGKQPPSPSPPPALLPHLAYPHRSLSQAAALTTAVLLLGEEDRDDLDLHGTIVREIADDEALAHVKIPNLPDGVLSGTMTSWGEVSLVDGRPGTVLSVGRYAPTPRMFDYGRSDRGGRDRGKDSQGYGLAMDSTSDEEVCPRVEAIHQRRSVEHLECRAATADIRIIHRSLGLSQSQKAWGAYGGVALSRSRSTENETWRPSSTNAAAAPPPPQDTLRRSIPGQPAGLALGAEGRYRNHKKTVLEPLPGQAAALGPPRGASPPPRVLSDKADRYGRPYSAPIRGALPDISSLTAAAAMSLSASSVQRPKTLQEALSVRDSAGAGPSTLTNGDRLKPSLLVSVSQTRSPLTRSASLRSEFMRRSDTT
ncbi:hypothetical protein DIPPA_26415 [Diplonema papillatum]|nr:hypothetical protein DIPPA_26415 [Diplonema papillatum]